MLKLMRIDSKGSRAVTEEEITASLVEGVDAGLIEEHEHQMVRNVFHLDDRALTSMMTPRSDIQWLEAHLTPQQAMDRINQMRGEGNHSWYPVCRDGLGHVIGVISLSHLLALPHSDERALEHHAQTAHFVPETLTGMELLEQMRDQSSRMLFVVDEYGEVQGLLTPLDLLEAITGELKPDTNAEAWATQNVDGSWLLDGIMPVNELKARLDIKELARRRQKPLQHPGRPAHVCAGPTARQGPGHRIGRLALSSYRTRRPPHRQSHGHAANGYACFVTVIPARTSVMPAHTSVIPAQAGIHPLANRLGLPYAHLWLTSFTCSPIRKTALCMSASPTI
jgi:Mg2+/Co2+ transporter CorC